MNALLNCPGLADLGTLALLTIGAIVLVGSAIVRSLLGE